MFLFIRNKHDDTRTTQYTSVEYYSNVISIKQSITKRATPRMQIRVRQHKRIKRKKKAKFSLTLFMNTGLRAWKSVKSSTIPSCLSTIATFYYQFIILHRSGSTPQIMPEKWKRHGQILTLKIKLARLNKKELALWRVIFV